MQANKRLIGVAKIRKFGSRSAIYCLNVLARLVSLRETLMLAHALCTVTMPLIRATAPLVAAAVLVAGFANSVRAQAVVEAAGASSVAGSVGSAIKPVFPKITIP